jgi:hypothetical protein
MCSPLKEVKVFNINTTALESDHQESPEDYKKHKEPQDHEESKKPRNPGSPQESGKSARVKENCQVSRIQNPKSLKDWQDTRVKIQKNNS